MQQAKKLRKGDKVAIVSLSSGMLGEEFCSHNIEIGVKRLKEYGLEPVFMQNSLKGMEYLNKHPKARAEDLKQAFMDSILKKVIDNDELPIVYNVNFGHATPRCALPYGVDAKVDMGQKKIFLGNIV